MTDTSAAAVFRPVPAPRQEVRHADFELAKLLALAAMAVDHYGKIVDPQVYDPTNAVGRLPSPCSPP